MIQALHELIKLIIKISYVVYVHLDSLAALGMVEFCDSLMLDNLGQDFLISIAKKGTKHEQHGNKYRWHPSSILMVGDTMRKVEYDNRWNG